MEKSLDWKPWYRQKSYNGDLTEDQKRYLDSFRNGEPHPAVSLFELQQEVQDRIYELEFQLEDHKETHFSQTTFTAVGGGILCCYWGYTSESFLSIGSYFGALVLVAIWFREWRKHQAFRQKFFWRGDIEKGEPSCFSEQEIQRRWELNEVLSKELKTDRSGR